MLLQQAQSCLVIIDVQARLAPVIDDGEAVLKRLVWLTDIARELQLPSLITEQYPAGLGSTVAALETFKQVAQVLTKSHFSAYYEPTFRQALQGLARPQVVLAGMETHVCVLQTAIALQQQGYQVYLVVDACGSRRASDKQLALQRMQALGVQLVSSEMVVFEWLHDSATAIFKDVSKRYLRNS